jgi:uncharacterized DUF497 family protein
MKFDLNPNKAAANVRKRDGVTFENASEVFDDD